MPEALLIVNMGTQEPRILVDGKFLLLKDPDNPALGRLIGTLGEKQKGLFYRARAIFEKFDSHPVSLTFPILESALAYVQQHQQLDRLLLVATYSGDTPVSHHVDDTYWVAKLAQRVIAQKHPALAVEIVELLDHRPHVYRNAKTELRKKRLFTALDDQSPVFICTSPGLPAVNQALLYTVLHEHSGQSFPFQVDEPDQEVLEKGGHLPLPEAIAETEIFADFIAAQLRNLVEKHHYSSARSLLRLLPNRPSTDKTKIDDILFAADEAWNLRFDLSGLSGTWDKYFLRAFGATQLAEAHFAQQNWDEGMTWLGDCSSFTRDLMGAIASAQEKFITKRPPPIKEWELSARQHFGDSIWKGVDDLRQKFAQWRNKYTHQLLSKNQSEVEQWRIDNRFADFSAPCRALEQAIHPIAAKAGISDPASLAKRAPSFETWNQKIQAEIQRQLNTEDE